MIESRIKPNYYHDKKGIDPIGVMKETFPMEMVEGFLKGNALKYIMRYNEKGQALSDLRKAKDYVEMLIDIYLQYEPVEEEVRYDAEHIKLDGVATNEGGIIRRS